jgi:hypothetical protein
VAGLLRNDCAVQHVELTGSDYEAACFGTTEAVDAAGNPISWDVIHFNEGLHSLWPRVNTSEELATWAGILSNFTRVLQTAGAVSPKPAPTLIYATMTPYMPQKWCNPPAAQNDVEMKNALAVSTVQAAGVSRFNDLFSVVTAHCGSKYSTCDWCDTEAAPCPAYPGTCGFHYQTNGWEALANATADAILAALKSRK